ncbi:MAG: LysM peptidoglycan-binding domain-containing protein [Acidimicrobiia bacterium]|nr:LysM peptidoglycan-binding domain-containing protein [Acidimicrobiia bacterium]
MLRRSTYPSRVLVIISTLFVALVILLASAGLASGPEDGIVPTVEYVVRPGDTVWEIARAHAGPDDDVTSLVHEIKQHNGIGAIIQPGDLLDVPVG